MRHVVDGVVRVDALQVSRSPFHLLDMAIVKVSILRRSAVSIAVAPSLHEVRNVRKTAVASLATVVRNGLVFSAVELKDWNILTARVALDRNSVSIAVSIRGSLIVSSRDTSKGSDASGSRRVTRKNVGRKTASITLASRVDLVRVDTVLLHQRVHHVQREAHVVSLCRRVALPLIVNTSRVSHQHVRVLHRLRELAKRFLSGWSATAAVEREDQAVSLVWIIVRREVQEELPLGAIGSGKLDFVALSSCAFPHFGVECLATPSARPSLSLAKQEEKAKNAESEDSN